MMRASCGRARRRGAWAAAVASVAVSVLLAACGSGPSAAGSSGNNLTWFFWVGTPGENAVWQHNADLVSKAYPSLSVSLTTTSFTDFWSKLPLEASANSMPCLAGLQYGYVGSVGNLFLPLNSLIKKYHYSLAPFDTDMIRELSDNGNLLALPYDYGPVVIAYNKALFKAKGVPYPQNGWTWSQFVQDAQRLTGGGDYGYLSGQSMLELAYDLTGTPDAYIRNGAFDLTNPAFEQGIQQQAELTYKYHVTPPYSEAPNWATLEFDTGTVAMQATGPWSLIDIKDQTSFPLGWVELPAGPSGTHTYNEGSGFGITKDCSTPDAAFKALTVLVSSQALSYAGSQGRAYPARPVDDPAFNRFASGDTGTVMAAALKGAPPMEVTTNWTAFQTAMTQYVPLVLSGQLSAAQFASEVQATAGPGTGVAPGNLNSLLSNRQAGS